MLNIHNINIHGEVIWLAETTLVIVESAAKAKTLSKFLGKGYRVKHQWDTLKIYLRVNWA